MRHQFGVVLLAGIVFASLGAGCRGPARARGGGPGVEAEEHVVLMESPIGRLDAKSLFWSLEILASKQDWTPDGRLDIAVEIRNCLKEALAIQVQTVFKGEDGFATGDESNWEPIVIPGYATYTYRATAGNRDARDFLVRIRRPTHAK